MEAEPSDASFRFRNPAASKPSRTPSSRLNRGWIAIGLCLIAASSLVACSKPAKPRNVVLITLDTFRADALGIYGNTDGLSPHIDAFAGEATVFENAVTTIGTTFPAHASLFTSLYPKDHGVRWNGDSLDDRFTTLSEILAGRGYETAAFVGYRSMLTRGGFQRGFSVHSESPDQPPAQQHWRPGEEVNRLGISWLDDRSGEPFFLWLHYYETHTPYRLSPYARKKHLSAGYEGPFVQGAEAKALGRLGKDIPWSPEELAAIRALYDGEVVAVDRRVGEVIAALRNRDLLDSTVVVLTADHGEALGEHHAVGHGFLLCQPVLHVPLVIRVPGLRAPQRIDTRVSLIDVTPTILDLLGFEVPPGLDGRSLAAGLAGRRLSPHRYFAEVRGLGDQEFESVPEADRYAVFDGSLKVISDAGSFQAFDLERDPRELEGFAPDSAVTRQRELVKLVSAYRRSVREAPASELDEEALAELRALGYLP